MEKPSFWQIQTPGTALFPNIEYNKPEQKSHAGRLGIIGGSKLGFVAVGEGYQTALDIGVGYVKVVLPDTLKKSVPPVLTDVTFGASNPSGSLGKESMNELRALGDWADGMLLIGDSGRNSETAILYEDFLTRYSGMLTVTRDAVDILLNASDSVLNREQTLIVASFAQLQKMFRKVYYPKMIAFSMQLAQFVDTLHKFTITYPATIVTLHQEHLVIAKSGHVVTQKWDDPMTIWKGTTATKAASYWLWNPSKPLESVATSITN